jgi:DNA (cytosine-5)-methyltransferase 1
MRHGSLFSGIGGFDLASEWMGWENVFHCEWNEFGQKVLKYYWPKAITYNDITKTDFSIHRGTIDIITGGFPCQPYSMAGKRLGKEDERHLWPEMLRCIREVQPTWVVGENVLGLVNWNGGLVFHEVQADLEAQGYEVQPYVLPAASVNAPHRRDRVWFVAYNNSFLWREGRKFKSTFESRYGKGTKNSDTKNDVTFNSDDKGRSSGLREVQGKDGEISKWDNNAESSDSSIQSITSDSNCSTERPSRESGGIKEDWSRNNTQSEKWRIKAELDNRLYEFSQYATDSLRNGYESRQKGECSEERSQSNDKQFERCNKFSRADFEMFPISAPICSGDDGISSKLDGITFPKWRNESIKAGGNAIVPQVVYQIFKAIEQYETTRHTQGTQT